MHLSELTAYAAQKYQIVEEHFDSPGVSVLTDPNSGKWVALLMRQWDSEAGSTIECCDIKCGQDSLSKFSEPYLTLPYRMQNNKWIGIKFDDSTQPHIVYQLFDKALTPDAQYGCKIVLGRDFVKQNAQYRETLLPIKKPSRQTEHSETTRSASSLTQQNALNHSSDGYHSHNSNKPQLAASFKTSQIEQSSKSEADNHPGQKQFELVLEAFSNAFSQNSASETSHTPPHYTETQIPNTETQIPTIAPDSAKPSLLNMKKLYRYGDGSFAQKCKNFYVQGKFMENFVPETEDNLLFSDLKIFFPTYRDLSDKQLNHYFLWRDNIRKDKISEISSYAAYIYIYELLNGIGTSSVLDSLGKLKHFEKMYVRAGHGDFSMQKNVRSWMFELAILTHAQNQLQKEDVMPYVAPATIERDHTMHILHSPEQYDDETVFQALIKLGSKKLENSSAILKKPSEGIHLFAETWRIAIRNGNTQNLGFFEQCFGHIQAFPWHPLSNAVYHQRENMAPFVFELNDFHSFCFDGIRWCEKNYHELYINTAKLNEFLHETDRKLRLYLKTGHPLQPKAHEAWASPFVDEAIEKDKAEKWEAARPKIHINFSDLDKIRTDAIETRDRLLIDEELSPVAISPNAQENGNASPMEATLNDGFIQSKAPSDIDSFTVPLPPVQASDIPIANIEDSANSTSVLLCTAPMSPDFPCSLDAFQIQLLRALLHGSSVKEMIALRHGMPEIIADAINEALYDEIGDSVIICDADSLSLVEDYRDDIAQILGETAV